MTRRPIRSAARLAAPMALLLVLGLVLAACGGGGGGGGGGAGYKLRTAVINETSAPIDVSLDGAEPGTPTSVDTCDAELIEYDLPDGDWTLTVNGQPALESSKLDAIYQARNIIAEVDLQEDNTITINNISAGAFIQTPTKANICS